MISNQMTMEAVASGSETAQELYAMIEAHEQGLPLEDFNLLRPYTASGRLAVPELVILDGRQSLPPAKRQLPGSILLYGQDSGTALLRLGGWKQRQTPLQTEPGDLVEIKGTGKKAIENPATVPSVGLFVHLVPVTSRHQNAPTESILSAQDVSGIITGLLDQAPRLDLRVSLSKILIQMDTGLISPEQAVNQARALGE